MQVYVVPWAFSYTLNITHSSSEIYKNEKRPVNNYLVGPILWGKAKVTVRINPLKLDNTVVTPNWSDFLLISTALTLAGVGITLAMSPS